MSRENAQRVASSETLTASPVTLGWSRRLSLGSNHGLSTVTMPQTPTESLHLRRPRSGRCRRLRDGIQKDRAVTSLKGRLNLALLVCFPDLAFLLLLLRRQELRLPLASVPRAFCTTTHVLGSPPQAPCESPGHRGQRALCGVAGSPGLWSHVLLSRVSLPSLASDAHHQEGTDHVAADSLRAWRPQRGRCTVMLGAREGPSAGQRPQQQVQGQGGLVAGRAPFPHASHVAFWPHTSD